MGKNFKNIRAWELADKLAISIYKFTKNFPKEELYGITSQIRRAAVSVPSNIAEGAARNSGKEFVQFLYIAQGSLSEIEYLIYLSRNLGFLNDENYAALEEIRSECAKTLHGLITVVRSK